MRGRHSPPPPLPARSHSRGFTLIEVLVVLAIVSLMSLMAWRGLDTMLGQQQRLQERAERVQTLQTALAQWHTDWSQLHASPELQAWDWDGQVLRLTRRSPAGTDAALQVVAWTLRPPPEGAGLSGPHWMRWQSPPVQSLAQWQAAWPAAERWAREGRLPEGDVAGQALALWPLAQWQLYVHRGGAWSHPLSSDATQDDPARTPSGTQPRTDSPLAARRVPDAVRVQLTLADGQPLTGTLVSDWIRPEFTGAEP